MENTSLYERMKQARQGIIKALAGGRVYDSHLQIQAKRLYSSDMYKEKITDEAIKTGVLAFAAVNNMQGGSVSDVDLYKLISSYLHDENARSRINEIIS